MAAGGLTSKLGHDHLTWITLSCSPAVMPSSCSTLSTCQLVGWLVGGWLVESCDIQPTNIQPCNIHALYHMRLDLDMHGSNLIPCTPTRLGRSSLGMRCPTP